MRAASVLLTLAVFAGMAAGQTREDPARVDALERRVRELEQINKQLEQRLARLEGTVVGPAAPASRAAPAESAGAVAEPAPAAAPSLPSPSPTATEAEEGVHLPFSGYMEWHVNKTRGETGQFDFHRFVLLFGHSFSSRIKFWSELELEHAFVEGGAEKGELELEQAYLDFYLKPAFNLRGGMVLAPVGLINERHEPPSFYGVERPMVDTVIIPSTWFDMGVGAWGDLGRGFSYRAYLMSPLDATGFSADEGIRGGRQKGFQANLRNVAKTARLEYRGIPRLTLGSSVWAGRNGFDTPNLNVPVRLASFDARFSRGRFDARGEYAHAWIGEAGELNRVLQRRRGVNPNIAEQIRGFYLEGGVHLFPRRSRHDVAVFTRYENFDTQYRMPAGFLPIPQFDRSSWTFGASYFPHADVVLKADYVFERSASTVFPARHRFNLGMGWWF